MMCQTMAIVNIYTVSVRTVTFCIECGWESNLYKTLKSLRMCQTTIFDSEQYFTRKVTTTFIESFLAMV